MEPGHRKGSSEFVLSKKLHYEKVVGNIYIYTYIYYVLLVIYDKFKDLVLFSNTKY